MTGVAAQGRPHRAAWVMLLWALHTAPAPAEPAPASQLETDLALCQGAIAAVEQRLPLPRRLMSAISLIESGRAIPGGRAAAWPWTINVGGVGTFYDTADAAIAAAEALQGKGTWSFDVGCMQVNLLHHPAAFASLRDAFNPALNTGYAASFLGQLHAELGDWSRVVAAYHSRSAGPGANYQRKVVRAWPDAAAYGVAPLPDAVDGTAVERRDDRGPEYAARLRDAAVDHAALTRRIVGAGPQTGRTPLRGGVAGPLRMTQDSGRR